MNTPPRLAYVHIGKSAGTWLRTMLERHYQPDDICHFRFQGQFDRAERDSYIGKKLFSAHIGHDFASQLDAELITVLRNPFDRIVSLYHYWREVENAPAVVRDMGFDQFLDWHFEAIGQDIDDAQTWQIAFGHTIAARRRNAGLSKDQVLARARENLDTYAAVGLFERLPQFAQALQQRFGFTDFAIGDQINQTRRRESLGSLTLAQRAKIYARNEMDVALYEYVSSQRAA